MPEKVIIIGSGPAAWTAAIYAARAELQPLVFEGALSEENRLAGTLPMGQLNLTTEVENYPGFPAGDLEAYLEALAAEQRQMMAPHQKHGVSGPELMVLMRQQALNFGMRIITEDVVDVDFRVAPSRLSASDGKRSRPGGDRGHRGAGQLPGPALGRDASRIAASAAAPSATGPCRDSATGRWP